MFLGCSEDPGFLKQPLPTLSGHFLELRLLFIEILGLHLTR